jgi:fatty acid desaturase
MMHQAIAIDRKRTDAISMVVVLSHLALVLAPVYLGAIWAPGYHLLVLWLWFGSSMNGLLNLMHECAHYHVFTGRSANDILGRWLLGPLAFADFDAYRQRHWEHHRHLGTSSDTKDTYLVDIRGGRFLFLLVRCLLLVEAVRKFRHQARSPEVEWPEGSKPWQTAGRTWVARTLAVQGAFFGSLFWTARWAGMRPLGEALSVAAVAYGVIYVYGLGSLTVLAATLRAIAEHQVGRGAEALAGRAALRNFACNPFTWLVLGCYGFSHHATHHDRPSIPYYGLPRATDELARNSPALAPSNGYLKTLLWLVRKGDISIGCERLTDEVVNA